jgi:hypothetical protein
MPIVTRTEPFPLPAWSATTATLTGGPAFASVPGSVADSGSAAAVGGR